jgi:hypothetical protein
MKFLCVACDAVMSFAERQLPGDGTMAAVFSCPACGREIAMLANPMETQMVASLGVKVGGRTIDEQPFEFIREHVASGGDVFADSSDGGSAAPTLPDAPITAPRVTWSADATERLERVPIFVRGMVKRIYGDYARERGIALITTEVMDRARTELGLEGM